MKDIKSSRLLLKATKNLEASLHTEYEVYPDNPETDFLNAAANVAFLSKVVFKDLVTRQGAEISANWALNTAISLGEYEIAVRFLDTEISDMQRENLDLKELKESIAVTMKNYGRTKPWNQLLLRIDEAA
ncbi:MAG: hypothetical protein ABJE00_16460 [Erythrobacter sp.]